MENKFLGLSILPTDESGVRFVKVRTMRVRMYVGREWIELLEEDYRDRVAIGFSAEFPGHLLIATAKDCNLRGHQVVRHKQGDVTVAFNTDPNLVTRILPGPLNSTFTPRHVCLHANSSGLKAIALEWPGINEYIQSLNCPIDQVNRNTVEDLEPLEDDGTEMAPTSVGELHLFDENANPLENDQPAVLDAVRGDEQIVEPSSNPTIDDMGADVVDLPEYDLTSSVPGPLNM